MAKKSKSETGWIEWVTKKVTPDPGWNVVGVMPDDLQDDYAGKIFLTGGTPTGPFDTHRIEDADGLVMNKSWAGGPTGTNDVTIGEPDIL